MQGITLKAARVNSGHTQESLAEKLDIDRTTINAYETGRAKVTPMYLYALSSITGFDVDDFILPA